MTLERNIQPPVSNQIIMSATPASTILVPDASAVDSTGNSLDVPKDEPMYSRNSPNMLNILTASSDREFSNR